MNIDLIPLPPDGIFRTRPSDDDYRKVTRRRDQITRFIIPSPSAPSHGVEIQTELAEMLNERFGEDNYRYTLLFKEKRMIGISIHFNNKDDALLFKLIWKWDD